MPEEPLTAEESARRFAEDQAWFKRLGARGWYAPTVPKEFGGGGLMPQHTVVINEELAKRRLQGGGAGILAPAIMVHGTEETRARS